MKAYAFLFITALHLLPAPAASETVFLRGPTQLTPSNRILVRTEAELQAAVRSLEGGQIIELEAEEFQLTKPLVLTVVGVSIEGIHGQPALLRCPPDSSALFIRAGGTRIADVVFRGCRQDSAVVIEAQPGRTDDTMRVSLERVRFVNNGQQRGGVSGAALRTNACSTTSCRKLALAISNCSFVRNKAARGGAIFAEDADLNITESEFRKNKADGTGGALHFRNSQRAVLRIEESLFEENSACGRHKEDAEPIAALAGGALFVQNSVEISISRSRFFRNSACKGGGAVAACHSEFMPDPNADSPFRVLDSEFIENSASCEGRTNFQAFRFLDRDPAAGGAFACDTLDENPATWLFKNTAFVSNTAVSGGAMSLRAVLPTGAEHSVESCIFHQNASKRVAGALLVHSSSVVMTNTTFKGSESFYGGAIAAWLFSTLRFVAHPANASALSVIENSQAIWGGGINLSGGGILDLSALIIRNNTGYRSGGGLRIDDSARPSVLRGVILEDNRSMLGGGFAARIASNITITSDGSQETIFRNNLAAIGGGFYTDPGDSAFFLVLKIENTTFIGNRAAAPSSPEIESLFAEGEAYLPEQRDNPTREFTPSSFLNYVSDVNPGSGGGVCLSLLSVRPFAVIEIAVSNTFMTENEAVVGGGMSANLEEDRFWNEANVSSCFPAAYGLDVCSKLVFSNVTATGNRAAYAGGVFVSIPDGVSFSCGLNNRTRITSRDLVEEELRVTRVQPYCSEVSGNMLADGSRPAAGADAGTRVAYLAVEGWDGPLKTVASGEVLKIPCEGNASASCFRDLRIAVKDIFNQTIVTGISDANLELALISDDTVGDARYTAVNGVAVINNTRAWGIDIEGKLTVVNERDRNIQLQLQFSTRDCEPGEVNLVDVCSRCPSDQYGFKPSQGKCEGCELNAECQGGAALVPVDGYWHSTPFSPVFRKCVHAQACSYKGREESLNGFYNDTARLKNQLGSLRAYLEGRGSQPVFPEYPQCREEYEGPLCGSCSKDHGHSYSGACERCPDKGSTNGCLLFLGALWIFILIGINCLVTLMSTDARVELVRQEQQSTERRAPWRHLKRSAPVRLTEEPCCLPTVPEQETLSEDRELNHVFACQLFVTVQLTETLKILINYLQVTSTALRLQTDWNGLLRGLLEAEAGVSSLPSEQFSVPYECNFQEEHGTPPSISALWMRLATPWLVLAALLCTCVLIWIFRRLVESMGSNASKSAVSPEKRPFLTSLIVVSIVSMYFSYIDVVRELLKAVNCIEIEEATYQVAPDHPYLAYATERDHQRLWAEDTALVCFQGRHLPVGIVGIVGLVISVCGIISIVLWLPLNRKRKTEPDFVARYWFLYQAYRSEWYTNAWESVILSRKVLITSVVVFSVHLGPMLQSALCAGILMFALALHALFSPFKASDKHQKSPSYEGDWLKWLHLPTLAQSWSKFNNAVQLNTLESASLSCSSAMFFLALILEDSNSTDTGKTAMVIFTFAVNLVFVLYMLYRLYAGLHLLLDLKLQLKDPAFMEMLENGMGVLSLTRKSVAITRAWTRKPSKLNPEGSRELRDCKISMEGPSAAV